MKIQTRNKPKVIWKNWNRHISGLTPEHVDRTITLIGFVYVRKNGNEGTREDN